MTVGGATGRAFQAASASGAPEVKNLLLLGTSLPSEAGGASNFALGASVFVNATTHDYHLAAGSPAIDSGEVVAGVTTNRDGVARPQGSAHDVGAFEYCSAGCAGAGGSGASGGAGGASAGGVSGASGASGSAGNAGASGASGGAGTGAVAGSSGAATTGGTGGAVTQGAAPAGDEGGCGCRVPRRGRAMLLPGALALLLGLGARGRRRRG